MEQYAQTRAAISFTIAAALLLSGIWGMWIFSTTFDNYEIIETMYYEIEPLGTSAKEFDAEKDQKLSFSMYVQIDSEIVTPKTVSMAVYDPEGNLVRSIENVSQVYDYEMKPVIAKVPGPFSIELSNNENEKVQATVDVVDNTPKVERPLAPLGQWLSLISLPVFALAGWFVIQSRKNNQD